MNERTNYSEKRSNEYPPGLENLPEIEDLLWERAGERAGEGAGEGAAAIWPGAEWDESRGEGRPSFQDEARDWWRTRGAGLDFVDADLAMHQHGDILEERSREARRMGTAFGETLLDMTRRYRELDYRIGPQEARALSEEAAKHAITAQEIIGHPMADSSHYGPWTAQERAEAMARNLQKRGGRDIDPEYLGNIFHDLETIVQHAENLTTLEHDTGADAEHVMDRATMELVDWAIHKGELGRWADGKRLGWSLNDASERLMELHRAQYLEVHDRYGDAPDPGVELSQNVLEWGEKSGHMEGWVYEYQNVLNAMDGAEHTTHLPDWAKTARGQLRKQGAAQMREAVERRIETFGKILEQQA